MAKIDIDKTRKALQEFDFKSLFIEELGWSNPTNPKSVTEIIEKIELTRKPIAELAGALIFEISTKDKEIPEPKIRKKIAKKIQKIHFEHVLIFVDHNRNQSVWHWLKTQNKKTASREHTYIKGQPGDLFISKISSLVFDISEFSTEGNVSIAEVARRIKSALDIEPVTKKFFKDYQIQHVEFIDLINGIDNKKDKHWYASVILNRLMFIYFLQKKFFLNNGEEDYLTKRLKECQKKLGENKFYNVFLQSLFFEGFAKTEKERTKETNDLIGKIKYLNGGLFLKHKIEIKYGSKIKISDEAFEKLFGLFDRYSWTLNDTPGGNDNEINPDVLGYIFEKYINQKAFGAYYTRTEITEYLCEQTVYKLILDAVNEPEIDPEILKKSGLDKLPKGKHFNSIEELMLKLDAPICNKLLVGERAVLPNLSLLDPACGSGAFLVAAMKTLINVYAAILGKIDFLGDKKLTEWKKAIQQDHSSINYFIKKQIITNNLYGVDIMEEATEIAKLRLFLALVSSANTVDQLEPLPNIDFNIMYGHSLIGMMRVDPNQFNKRMDSVGKFTKGKVVKEDTLFEAGLVQGNIFAEGYAKSYQQLINEKEAAIAAYKNASNLGSNVLAEMRDSIQANKQKAYKILNQLLLEEFTNLGIKYHEVIWDEEKQKEGKPEKRAVTINDIEKQTPFHWGYDFSDIFGKKDGFDAIITNPPWNVLQTDEKEFFQQYDNTIKKNLIRIEDWKSKFQNFMQDENLRESWLNYCSLFPHQTEYFKKSEQYRGLLSGKLNLYSLFVLQSFNLLKKDGYCGVIVPSGIYSDLSSKQLRNLLFEKCQVTGLFCFENRKKIFDNVHRSFKFVILSFEKGLKTESFPASFMRHDVSELTEFPKSGSMNISLDFIRRQSPESLSILEIKNKGELSIIRKLQEFPFLNEKIKDSFEFNLSGEFNMTNHIHLFNNNAGVKSFPLYEGKMIHQFTNTFSVGRYWVDEQKGRNAILGRTKDENQILAYQKYRVAHRAIARSTDARTMIATILPKNCFYGHSLNATKGIGKGEDLLMICAMLNSIVTDYQLRQMVSANLTMFFIYQLSVPRITPKNKFYSQIVDLTSKLICTSSEYKELWEEVSSSNWTESSGVREEGERNQLRIELDAVVAQLYGLTKEEFEYILSTFPIVSEVQKQKTLEEFKKILARENVQSESSKNP